MGVGAELAEARQSLGLSLDEVSTSTKISVERLTAIEQMDVAQLPSLVYLKGFLRAYAAEVQLDPDDIAQRYLNEVDIAAPDLSVVASAPATPIPVGDHLLEKADDWQAEFLPESPPEPELPPAPTEPEARVVSTGRYFDVVDPPRLSSSPSLSRPSSRRYLPAVIVLVIAAAAGWVLSANFDTIAGRLKPARAVAPAPQPEDTQPAGDAARSIAPERIAPAVPADSRSSDASSGSATRSDAVPVNATRGSNVDANSSRAPAGIDSTRKTESTTARGNAASAPAAATTTGRTTDLEPPPATKPEEGATPNLTGSWALTNRVESSSYEAFENLNLGFHLQLQQRGNRVTGTGQKWMENGRPIPARSRTAIAVEGTLTGRRLELTFTEQGARRTSAGTFVLDVADDGTLRGTFASDAAKAQGTSLARRMASPNRE